MKILPVELIRQADAYTIEHEPVEEIDLMERAANTCFAWLEPMLAAGSRIHVFCGRGNNGGDGLALARMLIQAGYDINACLLEAPGKMSAGCRINLDRFRESSPGNTGEGDDPGDGGSNPAGLQALRQVMLLGSVEDLPGISREDIVIDALFGSGLSRGLSGFAGEVIRHINASGARVVSIDLPSGLLCDAPTPREDRDAVIHADYTLTFSPPKLALFFPENEIFTGDWHLLDIGLMREFIDSAVVQNFMVEKTDVAPILHKRNKFDHKGHFGHALLICGSAGKMGAAVLAARGCMRSGPGLVTVCVPRPEGAILQVAVPEAMLATGGERDVFTRVPALGPYQAIATGPGIGTAPETAAALKVLIQETRVPLILDADALNILAENRTWMGFLPRGSILTPHPREFERLAGSWDNEFERNKVQRELSQRLQCYIVLKGANTAITAPDGRCFFNTTGNPGMATGGSGDVLTGILAGLKAQGYSSLETCLMGVYLHGLAGDLACAEAGFEALVAHDIIDHLGKSFQALYGKF